MASGEGLKLLPLTGVRRKEELVCRRDKARAMGLFYNTWILGELHKYPGRKPLISMTQTPPAWPPQYELGGERLCSDHTSGIQGPSTLPAFNPTASSNHRNLSLTKTEILQHPPGTAPDTSILQPSARCLLSPCCGPTLPGSGDQHMHRFPCLPKQVVLAELSVLFFTAQMLLRADSPEPSSYPDMHPSHPRRLPSL